MLVAYRRLIDDGFASTFGEGLRLEVERARDANRAVTPDSIEARRQAVQARGRTQ
jgi:enoyl-CoA hydratase